MPATINIANIISVVKSRKFLKVLLDSGSVTTLVNKSALPKGVQGRTLNESKGMNTLAGRITVNTMVKLRVLRLPEFNKNISIECHNALVFDTQCRYDICTVVPRKSGHPLSPNTQVRIVVVSGYQW